MKLDITVAEVKEIFKEIQEHPEQIFEMMRLDIKEIASRYLTALMNAELSHFLGRGPYERGEGEVNHRNGSYDRNFTLKNIGEVRVSVPRDRQGDFKTCVMPRSRQYEEEISRDVSLMFLTGISTRSLSMLSWRLLGRRISHTEISNANGELTDAVEKWRMRDLSKESIMYLFVDGVNFRMRVGRSIEIIPVLVVGLQAGDKESATSWREFFKDLKIRGVDSQKVTLGIMDGLSGLESIFKEEFPHAKVQRCQVHVARNVLAKVPKKLKQAVANDIRTIFYALSKEKARESFETFKRKWGKDIPSAVSCLERSLDACVTFFDFPEDVWISLSNYEYH